MNRKGKSAEIQKIMKIKFTLNLRNDMEDVGLGMKFDSLEWGIVITTSLKTIKKMQLVD